MSENTEKQIEVKNDVVDIVNVSAQAIDSGEIVATKSSEKVSDTVVKKIDREPIDAIFITEDDTFDIKIRWQKIGNKIYVEEGDANFDPQSSDINEFTVTFKYPSQGDYEIVMSSGTYKNQTEIKLTDIIQLELARMVTLVRRWSLKQDFSKMVDLDPSIVKAILTGVRNEIGMKAIL